MRITDQALKESCVVRFRSNDGHVQELFDAGYCFSESPGMTKVGAVAKIGTLAFPVHSKSGVEHHLFRIPAARGGNALRGSTTGSRHYAKPSFGRPNSKTEALGRI